MSLGRDARRLRTINIVSGIVAAILLAVAIWVTGLASTGEAGPAAAPLLWGIFAVFVVFAAVRAAIQPRQDP